jgi:hypothetical protein
MQPAHHASQGGGLPCRGFCGRKEFLRVDPVRRGRARPLGSFGIIDGALLLEPFLHRVGCYVGAGGDHCCGPS